MESIQIVLKAREVVLPDALLRHISACRDAEELEKWLRVAVVFPAEEKAPALATGKPPHSPRPSSTSRAIAPAPASPAEPSAPPEGPGAPQ
ncbi:hypothetical protein NX801_16325 [Streptomyces sp. LP05-1]|uniref:Uncharacterized protein n=1 Tax=Streptomyces pyxinae TaxID=2970734 RepID=A0ABT2CIT1_9ACTN|nr:hypothetical protein [Streptomyces sp. LP05-1]MCS0637200.1 hypothetical protein [Streptomyces sp. LP05-1]